jgi:predicted metal-binding protein
MIRLVDKGIIQVDPIVIPPRCYLEGQQQDCFRCRLHYDKGCGSPMSWCICEYPGHKRGCPNYGSKDDCSPNMPLFYEVFNLDYPVYAIYTCFDFKEHVEKMKALHPHLSERQCRCVLYWQAGARKIQKEFAQSVLAGFQPEHKGYWLTDSPEAMGTNVTSTLKKCGIALEWPCKERTYKMSLLAKLREDISEGKKIREKYAHLLDDGHIVFKRNQP